MCVGTIAGFGFISLIPLMFDLFTARRRSSFSRARFQVCHRELPREVKSCRQDGTEGQDAELVGWNEKQDLP